MKKGKKSFAEYPFTPMAVIDLVSILPSVTLFEQQPEVIKALPVVQNFPGIPSI